MTDTTHMQDYIYSIVPTHNFTQDGICFVARDTGLYWYDTQSRTWRSAFDALNLTAPLLTTSLVISPDFAADHTLWAGVNGGTLRSEDGGQTWALGLMPSPPPIVSALALSPDFVNDGVLFAGTMEDGVLRSPDRGGQWHRWNFGLLDLHILALVVSPTFAVDETLLVGTDTGVFRSMNGGRSWRKLNFPSHLAPVLSLALSPAYPTDGVLFAGTESCGLHVSRDRGTTWTRLGEDAVTGGVNAIILAPDFHATPRLLLVTDERLLISADGGQTWSGIGAALPAVVPCGSPLLLQGGFRKGDDQTFSAAAAPLGLDPGAPLLVGTSGGDVLCLQAPAVG